MGKLAVEIAQPRARTINERKEELRVKKLQKHPYFNEIVKRIVEGQSIRQIARWCEEAQNQASGVKQKTFFTWRQDIMWLGKRIRVMFKANDLVRPMPTPELVMEVSDQIRRDNYIPPESGDGDPEFRSKVVSIYHSVKRAIRKVDSEMILKVAFFAQAERLDKLLKAEDTADKLDPNGYKEILAMKDIGDALRKFEVGEQMLRGGKSYNYGGEFSRDSPQAHAATTTPPVAQIAADANDNSLLARVSRLDEVDRNLLITATTRVIDMIDLETRIANTEAGRVETTGPSEAPAGSGIDSGTAVEDESDGEGNL